MFSQNRESDFHGDDAGCNYIGTENFVEPQHEGREEEGTSIVDEQAYYINFPEEFDNSAANAEAYRTNETTAEMSSHVTNFEEAVFDMCSREEPETETNIIPDNSLYLLDGEIAFADDREEETWEELFEDDENLEETTDDYQENPLGKGEEKP